MKSIIEELFHGNVCPDTDCRGDNKEAKRLTKHIADLHEALLQGSTDEQKEVLEKFQDAYAELTYINGREIFVYAFKLGARIAIEVLSINQ